MRLFLPRPLILHLFPVCLPQPERRISHLSPSLSTGLLLYSRGPRGEKLASGHHGGGYTAGFSRLSKTRNSESVCPPARGSRNSLGNRFTSSSSSLYPGTYYYCSPLVPSSSCHGLLLPSSHLLPPYAPSGPYLRVLLIFSYYRWWACGHA